MYSNGHMVDNRAVTTHILLKSIDSVITFTAMLL
jgi:hypothetical protein